MSKSSMLGKWDSWYKNIKEMGSFRYGDTITYTLAADFLRDMSEVEDWGCGTGGFKRLYTGHYVGIDGSTNPFVDEVRDLTEYRSNPESIVMRHVLEHNYEWEKILAGAVASFRKKFCLILFTPFTDETKEIAHNKKHGVDVPDISFAKRDIEHFFQGLKWRMETHTTNTGYGIEHIYYIERAKNSIRRSEKKYNPVSSKESPKIAVITANLGGMDQLMDHQKQSMAFDNFVYTDENFPPRFNAMTPRLQAKIPKCFGWQLAPGYDYYLWLDSTMALASPDALQYFYDQCQGYDVVVLRHPTHPNVRQEARYTRKGIKQEARYIVARYKNEFLKEEMDEIEADKEFVDDALVNGGVFMYRNIPEVREMLKEWWYHISRYIIQDQISFPYVLQKSGLRINVRPDVFSNTPYLKSKGHKVGSK